MYIFLNIQNIIFFPINGVILKGFKYIRPIMNVMETEILLLVAVIIVITCMCFILMECEFCICLETEVPPMSETEEL